MQGRGCENYTGLFLAAEPEPRGATERGERQRAGFRNNFIYSLFMRYPFGAKL